eukprot:COSAG02_NODE_4032_length_5881_cov_10.701712_4_plen_52_part_00
MLTRWISSTEWLAWHAQVWPRYDAKTDKALALTVPEPLQTPGKASQWCGGV